MRGVAATAVVLVCAARAAADDSLARARDAVKSSDYPAAHTALAGALAAGEASPSELAEIYHLSGIVDAALGDADNATQAFARWLALDPSAELPPGTSPKITRPFDAASAQHKDQPAIAIDVTTAAEPPQVTIVVTSDPLHLIARARAYVIIDGSPERAIEGALADGRVALALPAGKQLELRVAAVDEHGNRVIERGSRDAPLVIVAPRPPPPPPKVVVPIAPPKSQPIYLQPWTWAGAAAVVLAGVGAGFGLAASSAASELRELNATSAEHTFSQALAVQHRGDRDATVCNIGFAAAGAAALVGATLFVLEVRPWSREARVTAIPTHGGGALAVGGSW